MAWGNNQDWVERNVEYIENEGFQGISSAVILTCFLLTTAAKLWTSLRDTLSVIQTVKRILPI